jgi:hypothetical protein
MKNNLLLVLIACTMAHCYTPNYLPKNQKIGVNPYGSHIKVFTTGEWTKNISGELIAIDSQQMWILLKGRECKRISLQQVEGFTLRYSKSGNYSDATALGVIIPFIHGLTATITLPLHIIVTSSLSGAGHYAYTYNEKDISLETLSLFARFPQGIPAGIDPDQIKRHKRE